MALTRPYPVDSGFPTALDTRRIFGGMVAREGLFPDSVTVATAGIAYANGGWNVGARPFVAAVRRGYAAFTQNYGTAFLANDASGTAWTIPSAPATGSRIDLLWVRATDPSQGEAATTTDGPGGAARAVPVFGVTAGTAATTPVAPALPAGALLIATVTTAAGAASITNSTFAHVYAFAAMIGGPTYVRTVADRDALSSTLTGELVYVIATGALYKRNAANTGWDGVFEDTGDTPLTPGSGWAAFGPGLRYRVVGKTCFFTIAASRATFATTDVIATLPAGARPAFQHFFGGVFSGGHRAIDIAATGVITSDFASTGGIAVSGSFPVA